MDVPGTREGGDPTHFRRVDRRRAVLGTLVVGVVVVAAGLAVYRNRTSFSSAVHEMGIGAVATSALFALLALIFTFPTWMAVVRGLNVALPWTIGARVFFVSQLGKYVPGSVWPLVIQMEAGRARGARRRTMLAANLITLVISCCVGLVVACVLLPLFDTDALRKYWWLLLAIPVLLALLHPRAVPWFIDRAVRLFGRPALGERIDLRHTLRAAAWSVLSWVALGAHITVLCAALGHGGWSVYLHATGGMALAVCAGVLFLPAPAGAGVRDVILILVLSSILNSAQALAVVLASRVISIGCDVLLAAMSMALARRKSGRDHPSLSQPA